MEHPKLAPAAGVVACVLAVASVAAPYLAVPPAEVGVVGRYYALGPVSPLSVGLVALVGAVAFAAGLEGRSDPSLVAGLMVVVGAFSLVVSLLWVLALPPSVGRSAATADLLAVHRWTVPASAALMTGAAAWYAWALGLVGGRTG